MIFRLSSLVSLALAIVVVNTKTETVHATPTAAPTELEQSLFPSSNAADDPQTVSPTFSVTTLISFVTSKVEPDLETIKPTEVSSLGPPLTVPPTVMDSFPGTVLPTRATIPPTDISTDISTVFPTVIDTFPTTIVPTRIISPNPTSAPSVICIDDPDFLIDGVENRDCEYVAKDKTEVRCSRPGVLEACRATCDPACVSTSSPSSGPTSPPTSDCFDDPDYRVNGKKKQSCAWVAKRNTRKRCDLGGKVEEERASNFCRFTCNPECKEPSAPTSAPTFKPSTESPCKDLEEFVINGTAKTCKWTKKNTKVRCKRQDDSGIKLNKACPSVCDRRCTCTNIDKIFPFENKKTTCKVIQRKKGDCFKKAGRNKIVADFCPRKCKNCYPNDLRNKKGKKKNKGKKKKKKKGKKKNQGKKKHKESRIII